MLFCTSLVALVGAAENQPSNSPRKLQIVNTKAGLPKRQWQEDRTDLCSASRPSAS